MDFAGRTGSAETCFTNSCMSHDDVDKVTMIFNI